MSTSDDVDGQRPRYGSVLDGVERLTAEEMDERRQQNMAYEYLCHLEEAKRNILDLATAFPEVRASSCGDDGQQKTSSYEIDL